MAYIMYAIFLYPYARIAGLPAVMGPNNRNPKQKSGLRNFSPKMPYIDFLLKKWYNIYIIKRDGIYYDKRS